MKIRKYLFSLIIVLGVFVLPSFSFAYDPPVPNSYPEHINYNNNYIIYKSIDDDKIRIIFVQDANTVYKFDNNTLNIWAKYSSEVFYNSQYLVNGATDYWQSGVWSSVNSGTYYQFVTANNFEILESTITIYNQNGTVYKSPVLPSSIFVNSPLSQTYTSKPDINFTNTGYEDVGIFLNNFAWNHSFGNATNCFLSGDSVPYQTGLNTLDIVHDFGFAGENLIQRIEFTYTPTIAQTYYIKGIEHNTTIPKAVSFTVGKSANVGELQFLVNDKVVFNLPSNTSVNKVFLPKEIAWKTGFNYFKLLRVSDNQVLISKTVTLTDPNALGNSNYDGSGGGFSGTDFDYYLPPPNDSLPADLANWVGEKPVPPSAPFSLDNWSEWINYYFALLIYYIQYPFSATAYLLNNFFRWLSGLFSQTMALFEVFQQFFSWMPAELVLILGIGLSCVILLRVFGR